MQPGLRRNQASGGASLPHRLPVTARRLSGLMGDALRRVAGRQVVDDARRIVLQVDHGDRVDVAVGAPVVARVGHDGQASVGGDVGVVRVIANRQVRPGEGDLGAVDGQK